MEPPKNIKVVQSLTGRVAALNRFVSKATNKCLPFFKVLRKAFEWMDECQQAFEDLKAYLALTSLVTATRKPRPYFQAHVINVLTDHPLKKAMNKLEATGQLIQWAVELREFSMRYRPRKAIKAQVFVDFITEFTLTSNQQNEDQGAKQWVVHVDGLSI